MKKKPIDASFITSFKHDQETLPMLYKLYLEAYKGLRLPEDSPVSHEKQRNELGSSPCCQWH